MPLRRGDHRVFLGQNRVAQKARAVEIERRDEKGPSKTIGRWVHHDKGKGDRPVKQKISRDIEISTEIRLLCRPRDRPIQSIRDS